LAEFPALPLWTDAYLADTRHLSQSEHGAYFLLLVTAWRTRDCSLPDDDKLLARYAGCDKRTWLRQKQTIMAFWSLANGRWTQKRLTAERSYVTDLSSKRAEAGSRGGLARVASMQLKNNKIDQAKLVANAKQNGSTHTHTLSSSLRSEDLSTANAVSSSKQDFDAWWKGYPHKVGKGAAAKAFKAARKLVELNDLVSAVIRYVESKPPDRPYCNPATWLNQQRWLDQPAIDGVNGHAFVREVSPEEHEAARLQARREAGLCADD
jgi:uncharacterized protein YdaU (DUF1376 family)